MWFPIRWLPQKPADLDLQSFQNRIYLGSAGHGFKMRIIVLYMRFVTDHIFKQLRLRQACAYAQSCLSLCCWHTQYPGIQFRLPCTPPRTIFHWCQIVHWDPLDGKRRCPQKNFGLGYVKLHGFYANP